MVVFLFSLNSPWLGDDIVYRFRFTEDFVEYERYGEPLDSPVCFIDSLKSIIESQNVHYMLVNGRYTAHCLVQLFCGILGQTLFSICNALVYVWLICLIVSICGKSLRNIKSLLLATVLVFISFPIKFMPSTQIGYIWTFAFTLWFLKILFGKNLSAWLTVPLFVLGVIAANGNEAISFGLSGALLFYFVKSRRNLSLQKWIMVFGYFLGALVILMSPGSWSRVGRIGNEQTHLIFNLVISLPAVYVLLIYLCHSWWRQRSLRGLLRRVNKVYAVTMVLCLLMCCAIPTFNFRSLSGANLMSILILLSMVKESSIRKIWLWMGVIYVSLIYTVWFIEIRNQNALLKEIKCQYIASANGDIFVDTQPQTSFMRWIPVFEYTHHLSSYEHERFNREQAMYCFLLQKTAAVSDKKLSFYPAYLEGKDNASMESRIVEFHPGVYLVIMNNDDTRKVKIDRGVDFGVFTVPYDVYTPDLSKPIKEGPDWKAYVVYDDMYIVSNLSARLE